MADKVVLDQRRFERKGFVGLVRIGLLREIESTYPAQVLNISDGGMYVELDEDLDVGRNVVVWIKETFEEVAREEYFGTIQWKKRLEGSLTALYGYGIEFAD